MLLPSQLYEQSIRRGEIVADPAQAAAISALDTLCQDLQHTGKAVRGLYLYGPVGRGKTYLMDCLVACLPEQKVQRYHYYRFMQFVHAQLREYQGRSEPLAVIAKALSKRCRLLCIDEFFVKDIGDAMLLGRLLEALTASGVTLVTTSNVAPVDLYADGLQRDRFVPAIALLQRELDLLSFTGQLDHRLSKVSGAVNYYAGADNRARILARFSAHIRDGSYQRDSVVKIQHREVSCLARNGGHYLFEFAALFEGPRSAADYIELAERAECLYVCDMPAMGNTEQLRVVARGTEDAGVLGSVAQRKLSVSKYDDPARRFISFIDEVYDRRVPLVLGAEVDLMSLYSEGVLAFEFQRVTSRLVEMQSEAYSWHKKSGSGPDFLD
ncbi:MAG: cell division protein ZapE [Pseudomonadales bacterium]